MTHERILEGEALFSAGKLNEAEECFLMALSENPGEPVALNNLGVIAYKRQDYDKARDFFKQALAVDPLYVSARENLSELPKAALGTPFLVQGRKMVILSDSESDFSRMCAAYFGNNNKVREVKAATDAEAASAANEADIVLLSSLFVPLKGFLSRNNKMKVIARVRGDERRSAEAWRAVPWGAFDGIVFPAEHVRKRVAALAGAALPMVRTAIIAEALDTNFYPLYQNGEGRNVCFFGNINADKGVEFLIQCIALTVARGEQFRFHLAGEFEETRYSVYTAHLLKELGLGLYVRFYGKFKEPVNFLRDISHVINTSEQENVPAELIKTMACGVRPLVRAWQGASDLFRPGDLFKTPEEFVTRLLEGPYAPQVYRDWVMDRFNAVTQAPRVDEFLHRVMEGKTP